MSKKRKQSSIQDFFGKKSRLDFDSDGVSEQAETISFTGRSSSESSGTDRDSTDVQSSSSIQTSEPGYNVDTAALPSSISPSETSSENSPSSLSTPVPDLSTCSSDKPAQPVVDVLKHRITGRKFSSLFYKKFPWLEYSASLDTVFCFSCRHFGASTVYNKEMLGQRRLIDVGVNEWQKLSFLLKRHASSERHTASSQSWNEFILIQSKQQDSVAQKLIARRNKEIDKNRQHIRIMLHGISFLARQGLAFRGHDKSGDSCDRGNLKEYTRTLKDIDPSVWEGIERRYGNYCSPQYQNTLISVLSKSVLDVVIGEAKVAKFFAVLVDETRDCSGKEQLGLVLRYFSRGILKEAVVGCFHMKALNAKSLADFVHETVLGFGLSWAHCIAQCYDGASVMSGAFKGVQARLIEKAPQARYFHCHAHRLNLVLVDTITSIPEAEDCFAIIQELYLFISNSTPRYELYRKVREDQKLPVLELEKCSQTRWSYWHRSLKEVVERYEVLLIVLEIVSSKKKKNDKAAAQAKELKDKLESFGFFFALRMLSKVLGITSALSQRLQSPNLWLLAAKELIDATKKSISDIRSNTYFEKFYSKCRAQAVSLQLNVSEENNSVAGGRPKRLQKVSSKLIGMLSDSTIGKSTFENNDLSADQQHRRLMYETIDRILTEINRRFCDNVDVLNAVEALNPNSDRFLSKEYLLNLCKLYKSAGIDTVSLLEQTKIVGKMLEARTVSVCSIFELYDVLKSFPAAYSELIELVSLVCTLPITTATNERLFSTLKYVKNYLRTTMGDDRLNDLLAIYSHKEIAQKLYFEKLIDTFATIGPRRYPLLY